MRILVALIAVALSNLVFSPFIKLGDIRGDSRYAMADKYQSSEAPNNTQTGSLRGMTDGITESRTLKNTRRRIR